MNPRSFLVGAVLALVSSIAFADSNNSLSAHADADSGTFIAATLCSKGSFECEVSPSYTKLAATRRTAAVALLKGSITIEQAQAVQDKADHIRSLLDESLKTCAQNNKNGLCTGDRRTAVALLAQAKAELAGLQQ